MALARLTTIRVVAQSGIGCFTVEARRRRHGGFGFAKAPSPRMPDRELFPAFTRERGWTSAGSSASSCSSTRRPALAGRAEGLPPAQNGLQPVASLGPSGRVQPAGKGGNLGS
jgi:hypothetical protein